MNDLLKLFQVFRKLEALFLPLLPGRWRSPPPSYRAFAPLLERLSQSRDRYPWAEPLLLLVQQHGLKAYHKDGLAVGELSQAGMRWMRVVVLGVAAVMLLALLPHAQACSFWVEGGVLLTSCILAFYGAMQISISAMWLAWGILYPPVGFYMLGVAPWAVVVLGLWGLVWHASVLKETGKWRWYDWAATLPIFFFWLEPVTSAWLSKWAIWQRTLLCVALWVALWTLLARSGRWPFVSRVVQFFWPASVPAVAVLVWLKICTRKGLLPPLGVWLAWVLTALLMSVAMGLLARSLRSWRFLFRASTIVAVLVAYAAVIVAAGTRAKMEPVLANSVRLLYDQSWPIWWVIGASTILAIRGTAVVSLRWIQALFPVWIVPVVLWLLLGWGLYADWFSNPQTKVSQPEAVAVALLFGLGATLLAWRRKDRLFQEWLFWGFFGWFLFQGYWREVGKAASESSPVAGWKGFVLLSVWVVWLSYSFLGKRLAGVRPTSPAEAASGAAPGLPRPREAGEKTAEQSSIALVGVFLLIAMVGLWMGFVDQLFSVQQVTTHNLFGGLTFLGIPLILYYLVVRQYLASKHTVRVPWEWVVIIGLGLTQVLQGAEHYVVGMKACPTLDALHQSLMNALNEGTLDSAGPAWVSGASWLLPWRVGRWVVAMSALVLVVAREGRERWATISLAVTGAFVSLAILTAEVQWLDWPGLPYTWAVVLRPWNATWLLWDSTFAMTYGIYGGAGILWGLILGWAWAARPKGGAEAPVPDQAQRSGG